MNTVVRPILGSLTVVKELGGVCEPHRHCDPEQKSKGDGSSGNVGIPSVSILVVISMLSSCVFVTG